MSLINIFKNLTANITLVFLSIILCLLFSEVVLRFSGFSDIRYSGREKLQFLQGYHKEDEVNGFDITPNIPKRIFRFGDGSFDIWSNSIGCFDTKVDKTQDYVLLLGDSFAWGFTNFEFTFGRVIEQAIHKRVLKCGVPSYGTRQELEKAKKIIVSMKKPPETIVVGYYIGNDVLNDYLFPETQVWHGSLINRKYISDIETGSISERKKGIPDKYIKNYKKYCLKYEPINKLLHISSCWLKRNSVLYALTSQILKARGSLLKIYDPYKLIWSSAENEAPWMKIAWEKHLLNLGAFKKLADEFDAKLIFVIIPSHHYVEENKRQWMKTNGFDLMKPHRRLIDYMEESNIQYVDLVSHFGRCSSGNKLFWKYDNHWNELGNQLAGEIVASALLGRTYKVDKSMLKTCD